MRLLKVLLFLSSVNAFQTSNRHGSCTSYRRQRWQGSSWVVRTTTSRAIRYPSRIIARDPQEAITSFNPSNRFVDLNIQAVAPSMADNMRRDDDDSSSSAGLDSREDEDEVMLTTTLPDALRVFFLDRYHGPRLIVMILCVLTATRLVVIEPVTVLDGTVAGGAVVFWWFQEHLMHKHLLHSSFSWYGKEIHEDHHSKPYYQVSIDPGR